MFEQFKRAAGAAALGLLLAGGAMSPALAAGADPAEAAARALDLDRQAVIKAMTALNTGGYPALGKHMGKLKEALARAPQPGPSVTPDQAEVYGTAALLLTMEAVEGRRHQDAVAYGLQGLGLMPDSSLLLTETAGAYSQLRRFGEGLALLDGWMAAHNSLEPGERARIQRGRGFALIELNRLDEAESAYKEALALEPGHQGAKDELAYIAQLRAGGPQQGIGQTTVDKSAAEGSKAAE